MRNLTQYPVTDDEIIAALKAQLDLMCEISPGDMSPTCISLAISRIEKNPQTPAENNREIGL